MTGDRSPATSCGVAGPKSAREPTGDRPSNSIGVHESGSANSCSKAVVVRVLPRCTENAYPRIHTDGASMRFPSKVPVPIIPGALCRVWTKLIDAVTPPWSSSIRYPSMLYGPDPSPPPCGLIVLGSNLRPSPTTGHAVGSPSSSAIASQGHQSGGSSSRMTSAMENPSCVARYIVSQFRTCTAISSPGRTSRRSMPSFKQTGPSGSYHTNISSERGVPIG